MTALGRVNEFFKPVSATNNNNNNNSATTPGGMHASTTPITPASSLGMSSMKTPSPRHLSSGFNTPDSASGGDSYRHMRSMIDRSKKEREKNREKARDELEELSAENEDLQAQVDLELPQLRQPLAEREGDVCRLGDEISEMRGRNDKLRSALRDAVAQGERWRRQSREHVTNEDCERLGRIVAARDGALQELRLRTRTGLSDDRERSANLETCEEELEDD